MLWNKCNIELDLIYITTWYTNKYTYNILNEIEYKKSIVLELVSLLPGVNIHIKLTNTYSVIYRL